MCDVDGVLFSGTPTEWGRKMVSNFDEIYNEIKSYEDFEVVLKKYSRESDIFDFWRNPNLYDTLTPCREIENLLKFYEKEGYRITFVSHCFKEHEESKEKAIKKYFKDSDFISTSDKAIFKANIYIEDNPRNIEEILLKRNPEFLILVGHYYNRESWNRFNSAVVKTHVIEEIPYGKSY